MYSNYQWTWSSKGNHDGTKGHHTLSHNLFYHDRFSRIGASIATGGEPFCTNPVVAWKIAHIVKDNLFYSPDTQSGLHVLWHVSGQAGSPSSIQESHHNLFWAAGSASTWTTGYTFHATDIHATGSAPAFTNAAAGDFSLQTGSPGKAAASDGADIGVAYNAYLKKNWLAGVFALPTQEKSGLTTSTFFTVSAAHWYQVWFYIPTTPYNGTETFTVEGAALTRDIAGLTTGSSWIQPGGPARWVTLGRHKATDGTLNLSWTNAASASAVFVRQLPNADEAYSWMAPGGGQAPSSPANLRVE
jgi:hypothetical protein